MTAPTSLAAAHDAVVAALQAGTVQVVSEVDEAIPTIGLQYRVGAPSVVAQFVGGVCAAWEYEVPVVVVPATDQVADLVDAADTALGLLAAGNVQVTSARPAQRNTLYSDHQVPVYDLVCTP